MAQDVTIVEEGPSSELIPTSVLIDRVFPVNVYGDDLIDDELKGLKALVIENLQIAFPEGIHINGTWVSDHWTGFMLLGTMKLVSNIYGNNLTDRFIVEVGPGIGTLLGLISTIAKNNQFGAIEYNPDAAKIANLNLKGGAVADKVHVGSLLTPFEGVNKLDFNTLLQTIGLVLACIPQVEAPEGTDLADGANSGNYYLKEAVNAHIELESLQDYADKIHSYGQLNLSLIATLLAQSHKNQVPEVLLNLAGRPTYEKLEEMFNKFGYKMEKVLEIMLVQDPNTNFERMVEAEVNGERYEFFKKVNGVYIPINATKAKELADQELPVYHRLYSMRGTLAKDQ